jgi:hypothetical protein
MEKAPLSDDEIYRELEAIKARLQHDAADDATMRESLWLLRNEIRDLANALSRGDDHR